MAGMGAKLAGESALCVRPGPAAEFGVGGFSVGARAATWAQGSGSERVADCFFGSRNVRAAEAAPRSVG